MTIAVSVCESNWLRSDFGCFTARHLQATGGFALE
ncbi:hypothetical protein FP2506_01255 [Fulvimarina pelagi HTCC2506]|uniref:Uncharacterized protein n=1 Tax=Fulvimarina pelagi HTCC2506 TaxID=314231 RepID=Q0G246_9HYPH|nr:hypothetical protein FP2506_01255 [Fulvimarina pelagi HTCC2506]